MHIVEHFERSSGAKLRLAETTPVFGYFRTHGGGNGLNRNIRGSRARCVPTRNRPLVEEQADDTRAMKSRVAGLGASSRKEFFVDLSDSNLPRGEWGLENRSKRVLKRLGSGVRSGSHRTAGTR